MEIIILFAIVGIISSIIKNAAARTQQTPPVVYVEPFQGITVEPASLEGTTQESSGTQWKRQEELYPASDPYATSTVSHRNRSGNAFLGSLKEAEPLQVMSLDGTQMRQHDLDLSEGALLNGIILSEILGPPKALKK